MKIIVLLCAAAAAAAFATLPAGAQQEELVTVRVGDVFMQVPWALATQVCPDLEAAKPVEDENAKPACEIRADTTPPRAQPAAISR